MSLATAHPAAPVHVSDDAFRGALGRFATGVTFVTASVAGHPLGLVVSSFASVSLRPPLVSFCPSRASLTWQQMRRAGRFGVNVLSDHQADFVERAAPAGAERFAGLTYALSERGAPMLAGAAAFLDCDVEHEHNAGDHWIVVGRVRRLAHDPGRRPLVVFAGRLGGFASR